MKKIDEMTLDELFNIKQIVDKRITELGENLTSYRIMTKDFDMYDLPKSELDMLNKRQRFVNLQEKINNQIDSLLNTVS